MLLLSCVVVVVPIAAVYNRDNIPFRKKFADRRVVIRTHTYIIHDVLCCSTWLALRPTVGSSTK